MILTLIIACLFAVSAVSAAENTTENIVGTEIASEDVVSSDNNDGGNNSDNIIYNNTNNIYINQVLYDYFLNMKNIPITKVDSINILGDGNMFHEKYCTFGLQR